MKLNTKLLGRSLETLFLVLIPAIILFNIINAFCPGMLVGENIIAAVEELYGFNVQKLSWSGYSLFILISTIGTAFMSYVFWLGAKIARLFSRDEFFTEASAKQLTKLKSVSLWWGIFNITQMACLSKIFMPKIQLKTLLTSWCTISLFHLLFFIVCAALTALVASGARLQKDQDLTV